MATKQISYSDKLKDPRWQQKRLELCVGRDKMTCQICSDTKTEIQLHHKKYEYGKEPWEYDNDNFQTLCKHCHLATEALKLYHFTPLVAIKIKYPFADCMVQCISQYNNSDSLTLSLIVIEDGKVSGVAHLREKHTDKFFTLFEHARKLIKP